MELIQPETKNISSVQFSIQVRMKLISSVVEITKHETFDKPPVIKGLFDIRMGSTLQDLVISCGTCGQIEY